MAQSLLTKESPEIRQFFRNIDTLSRLLDIQAEKFRPLLNGDRYMTDSELAGKLKLTRRTLADYRLNGKIPYYKIGGKLLYKEKDVRGHCWKAIGWKRSTESCTASAYRTASFLHGRPPFISYFNSYLQRSPFALHNHGKKQTGAYKKWKYWLLPSRSCLIKKERLWFKRKK